MRWLNYTTERSLQQIHFSYFSCPCMSILTIYLSLSLPFSNLPLFLIIPPLLHYWLVHVAFLSLSASFHFSSHSLRLFPLSFSRPPATFFSRWWPQTQAVGLYLVQPMIKSAGLTSASDRPIHRTDTPPLPHTGRMNNLCTISNMKEDLLTL